MTVWSFESRAPLWICNRRTATAVYLWQALFVFPPRPKMDWLHKALYCLTHRRSSSFVVLLLLLLLLPCLWDSLGKKFDSQLIFLISPACSLRHKNNNNINCGAGSAGASWARRSPWLNSRRGIRCRRRTLSHIKCLSRAEAAESRGPKLARRHKGSATLLQLASQCSTRTD